MTTSRTWLVLFDQAEIERRYQWPVTLERVLAEHRAAVAAVPISEAKDTSGSTIAAPAADTQAGEAWLCGSPGKRRGTRVVWTAATRQRQSAQGGFIIIMQIDQEGGMALRVPRQEARSTGYCDRPAGQFSGPAWLLFIATLLHLKTIKSANRKLQASGGRNSPCATPFVEAPK